MRTKATNRRMTFLSKLKSMKKTFTIFALLILTACGIQNSYVQQDLSISYKLSEGMTKAEVEAIMGAPIKSDFYKSVDEWFYCKTGMGLDEQLALYFYEGKLIAKKNYTVTAADARGAYGSCENFIKMGNYKEPEVVVEIRNR